MKAQALVGLSLIVSFVLGQQKETAEEKTLTDEFQDITWDQGDAMAFQSFKFKLREDTMLQLTDYREPGDVFDVFDFGKSLGKTSTPAPLQQWAGQSPITSPLEAMLDERYSRGQILLKPGDHHLTFGVVAQPHGAGSAAVRLINPEQLSKTMTLARENGVGPEPLDKPTLAKENQDLPAKSDRTQENQDQPVKSAPAKDSQDPSAKSAQAKDNQDKPDQAKSTLAKENQQTNKSSLARENEDQPDKTMLANENSADLDKMDLTRETQVQPESKVNLASENDNGPAPLPRTHNKDARLNKRAGHLQHRDDDDLLETAGRAQQ
ncbi:hypothetical protein DM01DRAFT_1371652 [Hesseltinella vesiculosa]|uniref:Uncharacterized protein n=1 Tax=Hesseltinella vesiculosa TaxID=101127 RepID=A0A1X2GRT9_9FUNG|nr:hypothetical protein DM01DRAFT_1371652 [Hesseltinella vesiculosa]